MRATTLPGLYHEQVARFGHRVSTYHLDGLTGRWLGTTWRDAHEQVYGLANGLLSLGVAPGDRVGIIADTRPEWCAADLAIVCAGAITVGIYPSSSGEQCRYILDHAEVQVLFVEDARQLEKLVAAVPDGLRHVRVIVTFDSLAVRPALGEWRHEDAAANLQCLDVAEFVARGLAWATAHPGAYDDRWRAIKATDLAMLVYTSGTTGPPKGVMLTHRNLVWTVQAQNQVLPLRDDDLGIVYLPLTHVFQRVANYGAMEAGATGVFAERLDKLGDHLREFRPTVMLGVPRVYEKIHQKILARVAEAPPRRQKIFSWAVDVGKRARVLEREGRPLPLPLRAQLEVAERVVFARVRDGLGGRLRFLVSGAAPIAVELLEFFHAVGLPVYEGWGLTETTGPATANRPGAVRLGTVGRSLQGCETRVAEDGELLVRGENVFAGYFRDEEATRAAFTEDGFFRTGDLGAIDAEGYVRITGRKKELIITAAGKNIAPNPIEEKVKAHSLISQCVVHGDRRKYLVALVTLDPDALLALATRHGLSLPTSELVKHPRVVGEVQLAIDVANREFSRVETIKRFLVLDHELTPEDDLLTPTMKLKRQNIERRYANELESLYEAAGERRESLW